MTTRLLTSLFSILITFLFAVSGWGQQYTFKRTIGKTNVYAPFDISVDKQGFVYVSSQNGSVARMDPNGFFQSTIAAAEQKAYGSYPLQFSLVKFTVPDEEGNLWIADSYYNKIIKSDMRGNILLQFGLTGTDDGQFNKPSGITIDHQGNIWVVDSGNHRLQKFDKNGKFLLKVGGGNGREDGQLYFPGGIAIDSKGNIWVANSRLYRIEKFDSTGKFLLNVGNVGTEIGQFGDPLDIATDSQDNVWVVDKTNNRLQKFDKNGKFLLTAGTSGTLDGQFSLPTGIFIDRKGTIWVTDESSRIQKFDSNGKFTGTYGSGGPKNGEFKYSQGIAIDKQGNTWVVDSGNNRVQKFDAEGNFLLSFYLTGSKYAYLYHTNDIVTDNKGNVWVIDIGDNSVKKFDTNGNFLLKFGSLGSDDGQFTFPTGITADHQGNIWVADPKNYRIEKFDSTGKFLLKVGNYGDMDGSFISLRGVTTDSYGNVWAADEVNYCIQKFDPNGKFLRRIRTVGLFSVQGITTDSEDNLWVTDGYNYRIQKLDSTGIPLLKVNGLVQSPIAIAVDKNGDIYWTNPWIGVMVYSTNQKSFISGKVYADKNQNCNFDDTDEALSQVILIANPGGYYGSTDKEGNYRIAVPTGTYTVSQLHANGLLLQSICPENNTSVPITLANEGEWLSGVNFANAITNIPHLEVMVSSNRRRRCFTNTTVISYSNTGYADATNVKVYLKMPQHVTLKTAGLPYSIDKDSNYVFTIGLLQAHQSGNIHIIDSVACLAKITGVTQCTKVWITPANDYTLPANSQWDQSDIILTGKCIENGKVQMLIENSGQAMSDSAEFRVFLDAQLAFRNYYKLQRTGSIELKIPANGKTVRLEADQRPGHPRKSQTNLTIEGCVASSSDIVSKGYVNAFPQDDAEPEVAIQCLQIIDSYDPNDKLVSPAGTPVDHYTPTNSELKYTIRFQNTGTDYAYKVVVVDTLSENLDIATLQMGAASHGYSLKVSGKGQPVLSWTFNNINLPDSTRDQKGSNGFIQFSIKPKAGLAEKARIENFADIFFDYNDPVRTNTTANVLYDVPKVIDPANQLDDSIIDKVMASEPDALKGKLSLYPNPTQSQVWIQSVDASVRIEQVKIYNLLGESQTVSLSSADNQTLQINMQAKPKGMYLVHIQTNKGTSIQRVVVQ
ncbi:DUF7619 domain-containing protein [Xanthocytophaga flava]|uniref:DUF7619 domain-containing protein n=1 Tax=Xanthocytophaga flava TaxID=3048013 RepID=UPI0028D82BFB|nr:SMP-30/gluconolactonase/LRE family protein [Xanthocytophaga flavus]MDJ1473394.1 SMP-30/gluconolactonase/LRE family protein [Xanthocytophaga flavus]